MTTSVNLRKILHRKNPEFVTPAPFTTGAVMFNSSSRHSKQLQYFLQSNTIAWMYDPNEDAWLELPSPALTNAIGVGAAGICTPIGPSGTVTAGTTSTLTTSLNLQRDLRGFKIRITAGPNAGLDLPILTNTTGAGSIVTVSAQGSAFTAANTFTLLTTRWFVFAGATLGAAGFRYYDFALNTWTTGGLASVITAATVWTVDGRLIATPSIVDGNLTSFSTGTLSAGGATVCTTTKTWTASQWINYQVRITAGTGAGQTRTITANTGGANCTFTVGSSWTVTPDATSVFSIEGNDDFLYLLGNNNVAMYRYQISNTTWTQLSPGVARSAAPVAGASGHWMWGGPGDDSDTTWNNEAAIISGRRIYSFRGNSTAVDYYDIPSNAWTSTVPYSPAATTIASTGTKYAILKGRYLAILQGGTNRIYKFDPVKSEIIPLTQFATTQGAAVIGDTMFDITYTDTGTITWIYILLNTSTIMLRIPLI